MQRAIRFIALMLMALMLAACPAQSPQRALTLEPGKRFTFGGELEAGDALRVRAEGLAGSERVRLHRCGPQCETTETVATWGAADFAAGEVVQPIADSAEYYLWIEDPARPKSESYGEALAGTAERREGARFVVEFEGRVRMSVVVTRE